MDLFLVLITIFAGLLRLPFIDRVPPELFGDEIDVGYQAVSLLHTGRDLYNQPLPTYIHSLSEWRMPGLIYATVPTVAAFGNTELGVRGPEILFGLLAPVLIFIAASKCKANRYVAGISAFAIAILPWHILYSRAAFEVVILLDCILAGVSLWYSRKYWLAIVLFALSMYMYSTSIVFLPLLAIVLLSRYIKSRQPLRKLILPATVGVVLLIPLISSVVTGPGRGRFQTISIFSDPLVQKEVVESRAASTDKFSALWYNKYEVWSRTIVANYLRAFSSDFLFIKGDPTMRHSLQYVGGILPFTAPLLLAGIVILAFRRQWMWLSWLVLAPIPASLTADGGFHATRLFLMIPPLMVAIGYGAVGLMRAVRPRPLRWGIVGIYSLIVFVQAIFVGHYYIAQYPSDSWRWWHVGFKSIMSSPELQNPEYSRVFINNTYEPSLIRFLFYSNYSPTRFHKQFVVDKPEANIVPGYNGFTLDGRYFFGTFSSTAPAEFSQRFLPGSLYVISQRDDVGGAWDWRIDPPAGIKVIAASEDPSGIPILYLVTRK